MQFPLKKPKQVALADKEMIGDLIDSRNGMKMVVDVAQRLGNNGREGGAPLGKGLWEQADVVKQLGEQMRKDLFKGIPIGALRVKIAFPEDILQDLISRNVDDLHVLGNQLGAFHTVSFDVKQNIVSLVGGGGIDLNEMILKGSNEDKIALFELVFSILYDVRCVAAHKQDELVCIVRVHRVRIARQILGDLMLEKGTIGCTDIIVHKKYHSPFDYLYYTIDVHFLQYKMQFLLFTFQKIYSIIRL